MSELGRLVDLLLPFFGTIAVGFAIGRANGLAGPHLRAMQTFLLYAALPALFFKLIAEQPVSDFANGRFVATTTLATAIGFWLSHAIGRRAGLSRPDAVLAGVCGSYSNIGYMGPPLVLSLLGAAASAPVALIFVADTVFLFVATPALMAAAGIGGRPLPALLGEVALRVATHPFVVATALSLLASATGWHPPAPVATTIGWLASASAPAALFLLGATIAAQRLGRIGREVPALVAVKLVVHPVLVWLMLRLLGTIEPVWIKAAVVMAALPPALNVFVLATQYRTGIERASACVLLGTIASLVTLSLAILLVGTDLLPTTPLR